MRLLLFNPETEYALASGASFYTPPKHIVKLRLELQLLPEAWANQDDYILVDEIAGLNSAYHLVSWDMLADLFRIHPDIAVDPWGWNPALIRRLLNAGVPAGRLPDKEKMTRIRQLAHRRTTIALNTVWNQYVENLNLPLQGAGGLVPTELSSIEACMEFYRANPGCWFKAPWSSSGRGVINTAADMTDILVEQWCRGILRRQGSVMGETAADRVSDFATEWRISSGEAIFLGLSCFNTSNRGKYISNLQISQEEMKERFNSLCAIGIEQVIPIQKKILEIVLTGYEGPCGVDMMIECDGSLRPFVELNLRRTMGMI